VGVERGSTPGYDPASLCSFSSRKLSNATRRQGLTLVHFSAQLKRFLWDRGCI